MFRLWFALLLVVLVAAARHEVWNVASPRCGIPYSNGHVTFGRVSLSGGSSTGDGSVILLPENIDESGLAESDLDTSQWRSSADSIQLSSLTDTSKWGATESAPLSHRVAGRWGRRPHHDFSSRVVEEAPSDVSDLAGKIPPSDVLEGVMKPLVPTDIWNRLTGWEFDVPSVLETFSKSCVNLAMQPNNQWVGWKPADKVTSKVQGGNMGEQQALGEGDVLVYLGRFHQEGYGSQLPLVKTTSILPLPPVELAELLMDSSRVKTYNHMSLGRSDVHVMQKGLDTTGGPFGDGETKIVRNLTKPPLSKHKMEFVTMMHARPLRADDGVADGGYLVVSRAVGGKIWGGSSDEESLTRNEILLGINVIQPAPGDPDESLVTAVTHVYSPSVPVVLAGKVGVKGAINFVKDIRKLYHPIPA